MEGSEAFTLTLSNPSAGLVTGATATTTVQDDDTNFSISAPAAQAEGTQGAFTDITFTVTRSGLSNAAGSVQWRLKSATGLTPPTSPAARTATATTAACPAARDLRRQRQRHPDHHHPRARRQPGRGRRTAPGGAVQPAGRHRRGGAGSASTRILNDDASFAIAADAASLAEGNSGERLVSFTVTRSGSLSGSRDLTWTLGGGLDASDLGAGQGSTGTVSFADGQATATVVIRVRATRSTRATKRSP